MSLRDLYGMNVLGLAQSQQQSLYAAAIQRSHATAGYGGLAQVRDRYSDYDVPLTLKKPETIREELQEEIDEWLRDVNL